MPAPRRSITSWNNTYAEFILTHKEYMSGPLRLETLKRPLCAGQDLQYCHYIAYRGLDVNISVFIVVKSFKLTEDFESSSVNSTRVQRFCKNCCTQMLLTVKEVLKMCIKAIFLRML